MKLSIVLVICAILTWLMVYGVKKMMEADEKYRSALKAKKQGHH
ncbi:hypothetical protein P9057_10925 [Gallibacterium anatis]|nr:hypothetical protein [Gallibacterium anatis]